MPAEAATTTAVRTCSVHCIDWPIVAAIRRDPALLDQPVVVRARVRSRDVVHAVSATARAEGVRVGMRRRAAEAACPGLVVLDADPMHEARVFERVARAIETITPRLEVLDGGRVHFPTRGPARYFGGDDALVAAVHDAVGEALGPVERFGVPVVHIGVADGRFAARLAARRASIVPVGTSESFLAPFPVAALGDPTFTDLLERLGVHTLGQFAALPAASVTARFGAEGTWRHALARGVDPAPSHLSAAPTDWCERIDFEHPETRVDAAAFAAKALADRLTARLGALGAACTSVLIEAETEHGERLARSWRHDDGFRPGALAERVRWQLEGWLGVQQAVPHVDDLDVRTRQDLVALGECGLDGTTGALTSLRLQPEEIVAIPARQLGFFGGDPVAAQRADRALSRVQGMLGYDAVTTMVVQGGRVPTERFVHVPWGEVRTPQRALHEGHVPVAWPGGVPGPAPARVFDPGLDARLLDDHGEPVQVSSRGEALSVPARLVCAALSGGAGKVVAWAGPWPSDVRWWDDRERRRSVGWHLVVEPDGCIGVQIAVFVAVRAGVATVDAIHD